jgi:hypothetical protein
MNQDFEEVANAGNTPVAADTAAGGTVVDGCVEERIERLGERAGVTLLVSQRYTLKGCEVCCAPGSYHWEHCVGGSFEVGEGSIHHWPAEG